MQQPDIVVTKKMRYIAIAGMGIRDNSEGVIGQFRNANTKIDVRSAVCSFPLDPANGIDFFDPNILGVRARILIIVYVPIVRVRRSHEGIAAIVRGNNLSQLVVLRAAITLTP